MSFWAISLRTIKTACLTAVALVALPVGPVTAEGPGSQACLPARDGAGEYNIINTFAHPGFCPAHVVLREGTTRYGRLHIDLGGSTRNETNHELTQYAKDRWQEALNLPFISNPNTGFYVHRKVYLTPGGSQRSMCVYVDRKEYGGVGQRGITTAFWVAGVYSCNTER